MTDLMAVNVASRALTPAPWIIDSAQIQKESFGYNVMHPVGDGPDDVTVSLFDFGCDIAVGGPESISLEDQKYSESFDNFTYDIEIHPEMIYNSSLVSFDTSDPLTGNSIGHIKFCTLVLSKMTRPGAPDLDVSFLKTKYDLTFNLTSNAFDTNGQLLLPNQNITFPTGASITGVNPATPSDEAAIIAALEQAVLSQLANVTLPDGMVVVVGANNTSFSNGNMNSTLNVGIQYNCNSPNACATQNAIAATYLPELMNQLLAALNDGSITTALNNIANANNIPGVNAAPGPITPPPTTTTVSPTVTPGTTLQQGATVPTSLSVDNVTPPANQAEEDAMTEAVEQAIESVLQNVIGSLPPGFNLNIDASDPSFANGGMDIGADLILTYPCSTQAECDNIANNVVPDLINQLLQALQDAVNSGALSNEIQNQAAQNGAPGLNNASVPPGGVTTPTSGPPTNPGDISGLAGSSSLQGTLNIGNVAPPANQADELLMVDAVEDGVEAVLQGIIANLPAGFDLNVDITNPSFTNGGMDNDIDLTVTYPCANQTVCDNIASSTVPAIMAAILNALQGAVNNGTLAAAIQNAAAQNGAPGLSNPSIPPSGGLSVPGVSLPGPAPNNFVNSGSSTAQAAMLVTNVTAPANQAEEDAITAVIEEAVESLLQNSTLLPPGFVLEFDTNDPTFANGNMGIGGNLTITYPCSSLAECDHINNNVIPVILASILQALQIVISNGELANAIQALAALNNVPNLANASIPTGGIQVPTTPVQVPVTTSPASISGLSDSSTVAANLTIENVVAPTNQADEDLMTAAVEQGIDDVLQAFAQTLPDGFDIIVDLSGASFGGGDMLNNLDLTVSYPCANQAECDSIDSDVVPGIIANLLALLQIAISNGDLATAIQNAAAQNGAPGLSGASVPPTGGVSVPTTTQQGPATTPGPFDGSTQSSVTPASLAIQNVAAPSTQAELDAMTSAVEQGIAAVLQSFPGLPPGYGAQVNMTGASFANGGMNNTLDITVTYPCSSQAECDNINNVIVPGIVANILAALQTATANGTLAAAIQGAANQSGAPGLSNPSIASPGGLSVPTAPQQVPVTTQGPISGVSSSTALTGSLTVNNVVPPANQAEEDAMTAVVETAIDTVLQGFDSSLPDGFDFFADFTGVDFSNGDMLNDIDFTISYPCTDLADCAQIESLVVPGLIANFIAALQVAIDSGILTSAIQGVAGASNVPNLANASVSSGGLQVPTQPVPVPPIVTSPASISGLSDSSTVAANLTIENVVAPTNQADEDLMTAAVEQGIDDVLQAFAQTLPDGFDIIVDLSGASFGGGDMLNNLDLTVSYPCANQAACDSIDSDVVPGIIANLLALLQIAISNGDLATAIQNAAAQNGAPGLSGASVPPTGGVSVPTTTQQGPATTPGPFDGSTQSSVTPASLAIQNVAAPSTQAESDAMTSAVGQGIAAVLQSFPGLPPGYGAQVNMTGASFANGGMNNTLNITVTYPCSSQAECDNINNVIVPGIVANILAALQTATANGTLAAAIQGAANQSGAPGLSNPSIASPGGLSVPTAPQQVPVTTQGPISGVSSSTALTGSLTVNNVVPPANQAEEDAMTAVVETAIDTVLQGFDSSLPDGFDFFADFTGVDFSNGDMLNDIDFTISYPCTDLADCAQIESLVVPGLIANFIAALQVAIDSGILTSAIQGVAGASNVPNLANASVSPGGLQVPVQPVVAPVTSPSIEICSTLNTDFIVGNVVAPATQAIEDAMVNVVEQAIADVLQSFTDNLPAGFTMDIDVSGVDFANGNMDNDLDFHFGASCTTPTECAALGPQFEALQNQVLALLQVAINDGSVASAIQNAAAQNGVPGMNNAETPPGSLTPTSSPPVTPNQAGNGTTQNPVIGQIASSVVTVFFLIFVFAPCSTPAEQAVVTSIFQDSVISVLSAFIASLPPGMSLVVDVTDSSFDGTSMANALEFTFVYNCADQDSCDEIDNSVVPGLAASLLAALNNAITSGALGAAIDNGITNAGLPAGAPTNTPGPLVTPPVTPPFTTTPPVTLSQSVVSANLTVTNVPPPANETVAQAMASVVEGAVDSVLTNFTNTLPPGYNLVIDVTNTSFANGDMLNNLDLGITYSCTDDCDEIQNYDIPALIAALLAALQSAIDDGSLLTALTNGAANSGVPGFQNPGGPALSVPTTTTTAPIATTSAFTGVVPDDFNLNILSQFSVTACQCDDFTLTCFTSPQAVEQNEVFSICLIPSDSSVFISNFEMTITGSNGFVYKPVSIGDQTYEANGPITTVTYTQTVLIKTYLVGNFYTANGGSDDVTVSGNAFLENTPGKGLKTRAGEDFSFFIPTTNEIPKGQVEAVGLFGRIAQFFTSIVDLILSLIPDIF